MNYELPTIAGQISRNRGLHPDFDKSDKDLTFLEWIVQAYDATYSHDHDASKKAGYEYIDNTIKKDVDEKFWTNYFAQEFEDSIRKKIYDGDNKYGAAMGIRSFD